MRASGMEGVRCFFPKRGHQLVIIGSMVVIVGGKVIDGYFCAVREKGNRYGSSDAGEAAGDGEDFVGEEGWEGRHADQDEGDVEE